LRELVRLLAQTMNAGALPAPLAREPDSQQHVTMSLGMARTARLILATAAGSLAAMLLLLVVLWFVTRPRPAPPIANV
jgi:preprotein translocase subunit SecD